MDDKGKRVTNEKPLSLHGLDFKEMLKAFLKVKPEENKKEGKKKQPSK